MADWSNATKEQWRAAYEAANAETEKWSAKWREAVAERDALALRVEGLEALLRRVRPLVERDLAQKRQMSDFDGHAHLNEYWLHDADMQLGEPHDVGSCDQCQQSQRMARYAALVRS